MMPIPSHRSMASKNLLGSKPSDPIKSCHIRAKLEKSEMLSSMSYDPVILARNVPHALRTDRNVSRPFSSCSDAYENEGARKARQSTMSKSTDVILFFFKIYLLYYHLCLQKTRRLSRRPVAVLQRASPDISLLGSLFHRHRFGKVSWHVYVTAALPCDVVSKKLQRHYCNKGKQFRLGVGSEYNIL